MKNRIIQIISIFREFIRSPYFGFVQGHSYLSKNELFQLKEFVGESNVSIIEEFESEFAKLIGNGEAISYATGRMGFFDLMRILGIRNGDEVIILGATCSVMVNAVLRTGATPVFSDIDPDTFGSSTNSIQHCITERTRMIVAQHSFGIPCDIIPIVELARSKNIFLLEDCALTLGSKVDGIVVGNFGDAALFSTDHSKPINTLTGGLIYTRNAELANYLRHSQISCPDLPKLKQQALWRRLLIERKYCISERYGRMGMIDLFKLLKNKLFHTQDPFLSDECGVRLYSDYPYPAKLPAFLAALGIMEVKRWSTVMSERKELLRILLEVANSEPTNFRVPKAYTNEHFKIIPLRFAWSQPDGANVRNMISDFVHTPWTWFMQPIIATNEPLESFGYHSGTCPISERIGPDMINVPCNIDYNKFTLILKLLQKAITPIEK